MPSNSATLRWMAAAFAAAAVLAVAALARFGAGVRGTDIALQLTARFAFLLFLPAYAGAGLAALGGPVLGGLALGGLALPLHRWGRVLGLSVAAAMLVHAALIAWLCRIGAAPARGTFLLFAPPLALVYVLALCSLPRLQRKLGPAGWRLLRAMGMHVIAAAFALDFLRAGLPDSFLHAVEYVPFVALSLAGFVLRAAELLPSAVSSGATAPPSRPPPAPRSRAKTPPP